MGTVVTLSPSRKRRRTVVRSNDEATILLFMGVRYVRDTDTTLDTERPGLPDLHRELPARERA